MVEKQLLKNQSVETLKIDLVNKFSQYTEGHETEFGYICNSWPWDEGEAKETRYQSRIRAYVYYLQKAETHFPLVKMYA